MNTYQEIKKLMPFFAFAVAFCLPVFIGVALELCGEFGHHMGEYAYNKINKENYEIDTEN